MNSEVTFTCSSMLFAVYWYYKLNIMVPPVCYFHLFCLGKIYLTPFLHNANVLTDAALRDVEGRCSSKETLVSSH